MKIERPKVMNAPESTTQETAKEPVQLEKSPLPKTDSVETKPASFYNFDNAPKLDPSLSINAKEVPAALIPGIPFREKAELPKTLPNGQAVDSGIADLGIGKTNTGPNHMGIDLRVGAAGLRNQLDDALKLHQGSSPGGGGVQITGLDRFNLGKDMSLVSGYTQTKEWGDSKNGGHAYTGTNEKGFAVTGTNEWKTDANGVLTMVTTETMFDKVGNSRTTIEKSDHPGGSGAGAVYDIWVENRDKDGKVIDATHTYKTEDGKTRTDHLAPTDDPDIFTTESYTITEKDGTVTEYDKDGKEVETNEPKDDEYIDPEGGPSVTTTVTPEDFIRAKTLREGVNTMPSNTDDQAPITVDPHRVFDPLKDPLVTDGNPDLQESADLSSLPEYLSVKDSATGPEGVNPNDPELGSGGLPKPKL